MTELLDNFHWLRPEWLLALLPALLLVIYLFQRSAATSQWQQYIDTQLLPHLLDNPLNKPSRLPVVLLGLAMLIAILALAGPSWEKLPQGTEQKNDTMIIIADLTYSMYATDTSPSRLVRTRYKLLELLKQRKEGQTALIAYSADAHVVSPLTDDARTIAALVPALSPDIMPGIGSNAATAFELANTLVENAGLGKSRIIWFADDVLQKNHSAIVDAVRRHDSDLLVIGVGDTNGSPIPLPTGKFIKDTAGNIVTAKLNREALSALASQAGGTYIDLQADNRDIDYALAESLFDPINAGEKTQRSVDSPQFDSWQDRGPWLASLLVPFVLIAFRRGWLLSFLLVVVMLPTEQAAAEEKQGFAWRDLWQTRDQQGQQLLQQGETEQAATTFKNPGWKGVAEFESGNYEAASQSFAASGDATSQDDTATANSDYNRGHALAWNGQLEEAVKAYDAALEKNPAMEDAKKARELVQQLLQQRQQERQQQQEQEQQNRQKENKQDSQQSEQREQGEQSQQQSGEGEQEDNTGGDPQGESEDAESKENPGQENTDKTAESEAGQTGQEGDESEEQATLPTRESPTAEQQAKLEKWLKQIPDDPGGLLRNKFRYERSMREREGKVFEQEDDGRIW